MVPRELEEKITSKIDFNKSIILLGPRQVGKSTLANHILAALEGEVLYINGDDPATQSIWDNPSAAFIENYIGRHKIVFIDEAQRLNNIGLSAKMIIDSHQKVQLFITGSSSLELSSTINEPLTGRKWEYILLPLSWQEIKNHYSFAVAHSRLEEFLITGTYPEVVTCPENSREILSSLAGSYLYKDILELGGIRKPEVLVKLLQALAWQIGNEVSYNELAQTVGVDKATVNSYIGLLEKSFVIFRLNPLARNLRNEINTSRKIYFYDNGIRNTVINNYAPINERNDIGALWENFMISERKKLLTYRGFYGNVYYWRTRNNAEIDYVEEENGKFSAFEFKWNPRKARSRFPKSFMEAYQPVHAQTIHRENFYEWI